MQHLDVARLFQVTGEPVSVERYGSGHVNETYLLMTDRDIPYILQKINHRTFRDVAGLMRNIALVTGHLAKKEPRERRVLTLVKTLDGDDYIHVKEDDAYWRCYIFVTDSVGLDRPRHPGDFFQSAVAFGRFQNMLADFPAEQLVETIPNFHNTISRFQALETAISEDKAGRAHLVAEEIAFARAMEEEAGTMVRMQAKGELPLRVTHNDTKLNNVLLDNETGEGLCVIDLDTVMPGLVANDFGDSIRFGASTAAEDEKDLSKVTVDLGLYEIYTRGFLSELKDKLTDKELETLPLGAKLMTYECGIRFLADYLNGDIYFRTHYEGHNLDRCRTQFKLVIDMTRNWQAMQDILRKEIG